MSRTGPNPARMGGLPPRRGMVPQVVEGAKRVLGNPLVRRGALAAPALIFGVAMAVAAPLLRTDSGETRRFYESVAATARIRGDTAMMDICLDRLTLVRDQAGLSSPEFEYQLAKLALDLGQFERAEAFLDRVARDDRPVHAPAHVLRAVFLLRQVEGERGPTPADLHRAERQLQHALALNSEMSEANELLGRITLQAGDPARAEVYLQKAARTNPGLNYQVAELFARQGRTESAAFWARRARDYYRPICEKEPDNQVARLLWASSEDLLSDHEATRAILQRGLARTNLREFHQALANSYLSEAAALAKVGGANPAVRLSLLENALRHDPTNPGLSKQISEILKEDGPGAERFREQLQALVAEGRALTTAHLLLGFDAWEHGRPDSAKVHWGRAIEADPRSAVVANNLAWALATGSTPDLPRALNLIDLALVTNPADPSLLGTRGRVLVRLKRWKEALGNLETALPAQPNSSSLHEDLAEAYAALGVPELAEQHRRLATAPPKGAQPTTK